MTVTGEPAVAYSYDPAGRIATITRGGLTSSYGYDPAGRPSTRTLPNGLVATRAYDAASRLTRIDYSRVGVSLGDVNYRWHYRRS